MLFIKISSNGFTSSFPKLILPVKSEGSDPSLACPLSKCRPLRTDDDLRHETVINHPRQMARALICALKGQKSLIEKKYYQH